MSSYEFKTPFIAADIMGMDGETIKRFEMIRKLSKGFTVAHPLAVELDEVLITLIKQEKESLTQSIPAPTTLKVVKPAPRKPAASGNDLDKLRDGMLSLFEDLKDLGTKNGGSASHFTGKIGYNQLDSDLQERFGQVQIVQYKLPNAPAGPKLAKSNIPSFQKVVDDVVLGQNVFLVGGAGTGKTTLAQNVASALGREYMTINCSQWTAPTEIIGGQTLDGYQEGKLIEAWKQGFILILDELPKIDPNTAGLFNDALAKSKIPNAVIFNSRKEHFIKHPNFAVIATGNVWPIAESIAYGANNKQDLSLLDRFAGCVYVIEKNHGLEQSVVGSLTLWGWCAELRKVVEDLRYEAQVSMRFMMTCRDTLLMELGRMNGKGIKPDEGKTLADCFESFLASNFTEVQQKTIRDTFKTANGDRFTLISRKSYRADYVHVLTDEFTKSGYLNSKGSLDGFGSISRRYLKGQE